MNLAEGVQLVSLAILSLIVIVGGLGVVLLASIVYSAFLLGGVFIGISGLYILLNAGFVAAAQVLIYVGAVNVLILFGIMLVNRQRNFTDSPRLWTRRLLTGAVCLGLFALLGTVALTTPWQISTAAIAGDEATVLIGQHFFTDFLLPFELASVLLLIAMVGAIILARREYLPDEPPEQLANELTLAERPREPVLLGQQGQLPAGGN
ncbi:NADH-quinone oxidoreductase subunit J [Trichothermofontia sp.]